MKTELKKLESGTAKKFPIELMTIKIKGKTIKPLFAESINDSYILAAYQGSFSKYDILIKYRQKEKGEWSRIRTPKHIHWAVDIMIKMHADKQKTESFLDFLISVWGNTCGIRNIKERNKILRIENLLKDAKDELKEFAKLGAKGEYSIKFLILLAKLLMIQEKTNRRDAYMFRKLLTSLKDGNDIFKIVSIATFGRR